MAMLISAFLTKHVTPYSILMTVGVIFSAVGLIGLVIARLKLKLIEGVT